MTKNRLSDDDFLEVIREVRAWKERDAQRTIKFQNLIRQAERKRKIRNAILIVTSIAAVILVVLWIPSNGVKTRNFDDLYKEYYSPYKFTSGYRDGANQSSRLFDQAVKAFGESYLGKAEVLSDSLTTIDNNNADYLLLNALTKQAIGKYDSAVLKYQAIIPIGGSYAINARWYMALIYLKQGKIKECCDELEYLQKSGGSLRTGNVRRLLGRLKKQQDLN
jgi:hypothetical protein